MCTLIGFIFLILSGLFLYDLYTKFIKKTWSKNVSLQSPLFYTHARSVFQGEPLDFYTHNTQEAKLSLQLLKSTIHKNIFEEILPPHKQSSKYNFWKGCVWEKNYTLNTNDLNPGLYKATIEDTKTKKTYHNLFIVKNRTPKKIAVILSTNTWQAYNDFAGISNYEYKGLPLHTRFFHLLFTLPQISFRLASHFFPVMPLPFMRPNDVINTDIIDPNLDARTHASHLARAEWALIQFLEKNNYHYNIYSDEDLQFEAEPYDSKMMIFAAHSEYWSEEMLGRFRNYIEEGKKALFLSGNNAFREIIFYKEGIFVKDFGVNKDKLCKILGTGYDSIGYKTNAPYKVIDHKHFVFKETNLKTGDLFGYDDENPQLGASGYETDKMTSASFNTKLLALGTNTEGGAHMTIKNFDKGGWIINFSSVAVCPFLSTDHNLQKITHNIINEALKT